MAQALALRSTLLGNLYAMAQALALRSTLLGNLYAGAPVLSITLVHTWLSSVGAIAKEYKLVMWRVSLKARNPEKIKATKSDPTVTFWVGAKVTRKWLKSDPKVAI